eukprot:3533091-Lingulodinium_polyedra.AAC.1
MARAGVAGASGASAECFIGAGPGGSTGGCGGSGVRSQEGVAAGSCLALAPKGCCVGHGRR